MFSTISATGGSTNNRRRVFSSLKTIASNKDNATHFYSSLTPVPDATPAPVPAGQYDSSVIVLLTDGADNRASDLNSVLAELKALGVQLRRKA